MKNLSTTVAIYDDRTAAEADFDVVEKTASTGGIDLADAALVTRDGEETTTIVRHSHHGWGKGAVAGALVGVLFPATVVAGAIAGATGGGILARLNRSLDRGDIKDLGETMSAGTIALVVLTSEDTTPAVAGMLQGATRTLTRASSTAEEVMAAMQESA